MQRYAYMTYLNVRKWQITFSVSLLRFGFDPNTSFPWVWGALFFELETVEDCELTFGTLGFLSLDPEEETGGGW